MITTAPTLKPKERAQFPPGNVTQNVTQAEPAPMTMTETVQEFAEYKNSLDRTGEPSGIPCPMCMKDGKKAEINHTHTSVKEMSSEWWMTLFYKCGDCGRRYKSDRTIIHGLRRNEEPEGVEL